MSFIVGIHESHAWILLFAACSVVNEDSEGNVRSKNNLAGGEKSQFLKGIAHRLKFGPKLFFRFTTPKNDNSQNFWTGILLMFGKPNGAMCIKEV